jgi:hypothetical protein
MLYNLFCSPTTSTYFQQMGKWASFHYLLLSAKTFKLWCLYLKIMCGCDNLYCKSCPNSLFSYVYTRISFSYIISSVPLFPYAMANICMLKGINISLLILQIYWLLWHKNMFCNLIWSYCIMSPPICAKK